MRLYLDTAPVIYAVEEVTPYASMVDTRLSASGVVLVASDLTRMECRVKPLRNSNTDLLENYDDFFERIVTEIVTISREVMDRATEIRAKYALKTPDAIHLAAAIISNCDGFLTNDHRLNRFEDITIEKAEPKGIE